MHTAHFRTHSGMAPLLAVRARRQSGLTLIEFMVSIVIGMLMIAALATLIASQSSSRAEIDKSGRMIENGRYGVQTLATDVQLAGYWGELTSQPAASAVQPCNATAANLDLAMGTHIQGFDAPATLPNSLALCVKNHKPDTDVLVVRRADPDTSSQENAAGDVDLSKIVAGQAYVQTGLDSSGSKLISALAIGSADTAANAAAFALKRKDKVKLAKIRKVVVHIYYVSNCSVQVGTSCTGADGGTPIPTLKRVELGAKAGAPDFTAVTLAEGVENLQIDYGMDTDGDGAPNGTDANGSTFTAAQWGDVMSLKVFLLARSNEPSGGVLPSKSYVLGTAGSVTIAAGETNFKRHVFSQSVRLVNPSGRRAM